MALPTYTPDWSYFTDAMQNTYILGSGWLLPLLLVFIVMILITKDINKWKTLMFPLLVLINIVGIPVNMVIMIVAGLIFVMEALSTEMGGSLLNSVVSRINPKFKTEKQIKATNPRLFNRDLFKKIKIKLPNKGISDSDIRNIYKKNTGKEL